MLRHPEQTLGKLIDHQKTAYLGSVADDGFPRIRAMLAPRKRLGLKTFFFSTNTSSQKVSQFRDNPKACAYFCDRRFFRGVMLQGYVEVLTDAASKEMLWEKGDTQYYPQGVTDPDYCELKFTAVSGRYYAKFQSQDFPIESP